jgi:hypothetical protein
MLPAIRYPATSTLSRSLGFGPWSIHTGSAIGPSTRSPLHVASRLVTRSLPVTVPESGDKFGSQFRENDLLKTLTQPQQLRWVGANWLQVRATRRLLAPIQASTDLPFLKLHLQEYQHYHRGKQVSHISMAIVIAAVSTFGLAPHMIMFHGYETIPVLLGTFAAMAPFGPLAWYHHTRYREISLMLMKVKYRLGDPNPLGPSHYQDRCVFDTTCQ